MDVLDNRFADVGASIARPPCEIGESARTANGRPYRIRLSNIIVYIIRTTLNKGLFPLALFSVAFCKLQLQLLSCT